MYSIILKSTAVVRFSRVLEAVSHYPLSSPRTDSLVRSSDALNLGQRSEIVT